MSKRNITYIKPEEPLFLQRIKAQVGYKAGPTVDTKRQDLDLADSADFEDTEDERPQVVVLKEGDLTAEEAEEVKQILEKEVEETPADLSERIIFKAPTKNKTKEEASNKRKSEELSSKSKKTKTKSLLSFDEEEEDDWVNTDMEVNVMGEVEEMHSKEEVVEETQVLNGEVTENKSVNSKMIVDNTVEDETPMEVGDSDNEQGLSNKEVYDIEADENSVHSVNEVNDNEKDKNDIVHNDEEIHQIDDNSEDEVHEIEDDDVAVIEDDVNESNASEEKDSSKTDLQENGVSKDETIVLNDSGEADECETPKENGKSHTPEKLQNIEDDDDDVIALDAPVKTSKDQKDKSDTSPRRSSRNVNKSRSYTEDDERADKIQQKKTEESVSEESDIEEVLPQDPLGGADPLRNVKPTAKKPKTSATIVVKDTKSLVEIAAKSSSNSTGKKEPTLVIIDTNSILSGRGPVPLTSKPPPVTQSYTLPAAVPAQGLYPANMRATITPIPLNSSVTMTTQIPVNTSSNNNSQTTIQKSTPTPPQPQILPSLTDDMFVVEAPSFIVPYVYEKPPLKDFKEYVKDLADRIKEQIRKEEEEERKLEENEKKERESNDVDNKDKKNTELEDDDEKSNESTQMSSKKDQKTDDKPDVEEVEPKKDPTYFESPLGKFFIEIGYNLVQEFVQTDLLKQQKRKRDREGGQNIVTNKTIQSLLKSLEYSKENNHPFKMEIKKCEFCSFKTESALAMAFHLETPHMKNYIYRCNFCPFEVRSPHDILFHMEAEHAVRGRLERAPAFHQCPNCPFEDNQKGKLSRHSVACTRKFKLEKNLEPPIDWEPPAKIPRVTRMKQPGLTSAAAMYQMSKNPNYQMLSKIQSLTSAINRGRGRPTLGTTVKNSVVRQTQGMVYKQTMSGGSVLVPTNYQLSGNQLYQVIGGHDTGGRIGPGGPMAFLPNFSAASNSASFQQPQNQTKKSVHQPSISITPLPRGSSTTATPSAKPGDSNAKSSFVICEICDGYIKDLEQLRNHMQWIHKVKIHPKMIYNRPPLNCQKCQFRFFTDQGLERHLLGSHGLVTSSMQEAANRSKDSGRCPVCGRVYQWKLLNHVARDHNMTLKPAHLSYKCTVCTATFGMYKQFENHVYSAHSVVAKRVMDKKSSSSSSQSQKTDSLLKPLKINDEITIIPQAPKSSGASTSKEGSPSSTSAGSSSRNSVNGPSTSKS